jgi:hypothetical protein
VQVLERFESDDIAKAVQEACELWTKTGARQGISQGVRLKETHVDFRNDVSPGKQAMSERLCIPGRAEKKPPRF